MRLRHRIAHTVILFGLFVLLLGFLGFWIFEYKLAPTVLAMTETRARAIAMEAITTGVRQTMAQNFHYDELITIQKNSEGKVAYVQANTLMMGDLSAKIALSIQERLRSMNEQQIMVPIGSVIGGPILAGRGPSIPVRFIPMGSALTDFNSVFDKAGINQTRHRVFLNVSVTVRIVVPTSSANVEVKTTLPIVETIIIGDVPQTYVDVNDMGKALEMVE